MRSNRGREECYCSILLLGSCGTSKNVQDSGSTSASHQKENATKGSASRQSETAKLEVQRTKRQKAMSSTYFSVLSERKG